MSLMTEKTYGSQLDKDLKIEGVKLLTSTETTDLGKLKAIYEYVNKNIGWNGMKADLLPMD